MHLAPLADYPIAIPETSIDLTDLQNETAENVARAGTLGDLALREMIGRLNPDFIPCADRGAGEPKEAFEDFELGWIHFATWERRAEARELLGAFWIYNIFPEVDTPDALACRASIVPLFQCDPPEPLRSAEITGRIMLRLMDIETTFDNGRVFQVIEWVFPIPLNQRSNRPGLPGSIETDKTLSILQDAGHAREDFDDGNPFRVRHHNAARIKSDFRRRRR